MVEQVERSVALTHIATNGETRRTLHHLVCALLQRSRLEKVLSGILKSVDGKVFPVPNHTEISLSFLFYGCGSRGLSENVVNVALFRTQIRFGPPYQSTKFRIGITHFSCSSPNCSGCGRVRNEFFQLLLVSVSTCTIAGAHDEGTLERPLDENLVLLAHWHPAISPRTRGRDVIDSL